MSVCSNSSRVEFREIELDEERLLLFPVNMFWGENIKLGSYQRGDIVTSKIDTFDIIRYKKCGVWSIYDLGFKLKIFGRGIYFAIFEIDDFDEYNMPLVQGRLHQMIPTNLFEEIEINEVRRRY